MNFAAETNDPKLPGLFRAAALDLQLSQDKDVHTASSLLANGKYLSFLQLAETWAQQQYGSADEHRRWNQLACLLSKYPFCDPSLDRDGVAMSKFYRSEQRCRRVNTRLSLIDKLSRDHAGKPLLSHMRRYIRKVLGRKPDMHRIYDGCGFGPGSSIGVSGNATHLGAKVTSQSITVTPSCLPYALAAVLHNQHYAEVLFKGVYCYDVDWAYAQLESRIKFVAHNNITCVPKNAKTSRTIATEALWNGYVQKGIDLEMRRKLKRVGINLNSQHLNQKLAWLGSLYGDYATLDLSAASDSVSTELVRLVLPAEWFRLLNDTRSHSWRYVDQTVNVEFTGGYEKFCSMGNGFCFPLETLIFASVVDYVYTQTGTINSAFIARAVYGDDIIVAQSDALYVIECLKLVGFNVNRDKTFVAGPFRESCGADYYHGVNVRPVYHKEVKEHPSEWYPLANTFYHRKMDRCRRYVLEEYVTRQWQYFRPPGRYEDDTALDAHQDEFLSCRHTKWCKSEQRWLWRVVRRVAAEDPRVPSDKLLLMGALAGAFTPGDTKIRPKNNKDGFEVGQRRSPKFTMRNCATTRVTRS